MYRVVFLYGIVQGELAAAADMVVLYKTDQLLTKTGVFFFDKGKIFGHIGVKR